MKNNIIKNIPNFITISRIIASVLGAGFFVLGNVPVAAGLYIYGAVSDFFDGKAAKMLNAYSELGRKLDAFSDKLYAASLLLPSILGGNLLMLIPTLLELKISYINLKADKLGFNSKTIRIGKFKTAMLFPTMILGLLTTISIEFLPLFLILFPISTILQINSNICYNNLLQYNIKNKDLNKTKINNHVTKKEENKLVEKNYSINKCYNKSVDLLDELAFYIMTPRFNLYDEKEKIKSKVKRRVR